MTQEDQEDPLFRAYCDYLRQFAVDAQQEAETLLISVQIPHEERFNRTKLNQYMMNEVLKQMLQLKNSELWEIRKIGRITQNQVAPLPEDYSNRVLSSLLISLRQSEFHHLPDESHVIRDPSNKMIASLAGLSFQEGVDNAFDTFKWMKVAPNVEKLNFGKVDPCSYWAWLPILIYQQQLRAMVIELEHPGTTIINLAAVPSHRSALVGPKFKSLKLIDMLYWLYDSDSYSMADFIAKHGHQLRKLVLGALWPVPWSLMQPVPYFSQLKHLDICMRYEFCRDSLGEHLFENVPWNQLTTFALHLVIRPIGTFVDCFDFFNQLCNVKNLSLTITFDAGDQDKFPIMYGHISNIEFMEEMANYYRDTAQIFRNPSQIEVFRLNVQVPDDYEFVHFHELSLYDALNDYFIPTMRASLRKLIITVPNILSERRGNYLHLNFSYDNLAKLQSLVLNYSEYCPSEIITKLVNDSNNNHSQSVRHLTIINLQFINSSIFSNISTVFPNLFELNISASTEAVYAQFPAQEFAQMIDRLKELRNMRFMDNYWKVNQICFGTRALYNRAERLKPKVPMILRIPLDWRSSLPENIIKWVPQSDWMQVF